MKGLASTSRTLVQLSSRPMTSSSSSTLCLRPQHRSISFRPDGKPVGPTGINPILEKYLKQKPKSKNAAVTGAPQMGSTATDSIFEDQEANDRAQVVRDRREAKGKVASPFGEGERNLDAMALVLDPVPENRRRWERKMVIKQIQKRGRLSRTQVLRRTEREHLSKSHFIKTSYKKLGMLARQIAGKTLDEAIVQMRFSKKKAAKEVKVQLEMARDEAIVTRGMGLGSSANEGAILREPRDIQLKDGKRKTVTDLSKVYIDQAWVNKGPSEKQQEFRAKGRVNLLTKPYTSISVLLKEEFTRVRLHDEKQKKLENRKLWTQLPDRPISEQRQYPLW